MEGSYPGTRVCAGRRMEMECGRKSLSCYSTAGGGMSDYRTEIGRRHQRLWGSMSGARLQ